MADYAALSHPTSNSNGLKSGNLIPDGAAGRDWPSGKGELVAPCIWMSEIACFFSADDLTKLQNGRDDVQRQYRALQERYFVRNFDSDRAREYARQGFCRRLDVLARSVNFVFNVLPPEQEKIPERDDVVAAMMLIQSFTINVAGCLDNLAWVWVYETDLRGKDGKEIDVRLVGLGESYWYLRKSFTRPFRKYLNKRKKWFRHIAEFRDTLAHRIPLYIPPYIISENDTPKYNQFSQDCTEAMARGDYEKYDQLRAEQDKLGTFRPWMMHSPTECSPVAVFHWQMLQDYATVDEIGREMLTELDRFEQLRAAKQQTANKLLQPELRVWATTKLVILSVVYWLFHFFS